MSSCRATVGVMAPVSGSLDGLGVQQADWASLAVTVFDETHGARIGVQVANTALEPALAVTIARRFVADPSVLAVVGPASGAEVRAVGPLLGRARMAFVSPSASSDDLFTGRFPTFFGTVAKRGEEGVFDARFIAGHLGARHVAVIVDGSPYSADLAGPATRTLERHHVSVYAASVSQSAVNYSAVVAHLPADVSVVYLPWQIAGEAQLFAGELAAAHRKVVVVGSDQVAVPIEFHATGDYVTEFGPQLSSTGSAGRLLRRFAATYHLPATTAGPPAYVAATVVLDGIEAACASGRPSRAKVLAAVRRTDLATSLVGRPVRFDRYGLQLGATLYMFRVGHGGGYVEIPAATSTATPGHA